VMQRSVENGLAFLFCDPARRMMAEKLVEDTLRKRLARRIDHVDAECPHRVVRLRHRRIEHENRADDASSSQLADRGPRALVRRFGKNNSPRSCGRAEMKLGEKAHFDERRFLSAAATAGCTRLETSPPYRAISRTRLALMYVVSSDGTMNTVSSLGDRW